MLLWHLLSISFYEIAAEALRCYSCASAEYRMLLDRSSSFGRTVRNPPHFDRFCDSEESIKAIAPMEPCMSTCITVYEPQFFGGLQSVNRPFLFIRGCADRIFESMTIRPREIDFLHQAPICVSLHMSDIYPHVQANEVVKVCSCTDNGCNYRTSAVNTALHTTMHIFILILLFIYLY
ncbi:unnamed protein product [Auanema sp. JU1783]|nr:unnamed protein product [Auanema sp. JU1783]